MTAAHIEKRSTNVIKIIVMVFVFQAVAALSQSGKGADSPEFINQKLMTLAGQHGVSCGTAKAGQDISSQNACVLRQFKNRKPFFVSYQLEGIDSDSVAGLVRSTDGTMYELHYDSLGFSSPGENEVISDSGHLITITCPKPYHVDISRDGKWMTCRLVRKHGRNPR